MYHYNLYEIYELHRRANYKFDRLINSSPQLKVPFHTAKPIVAAISLIRETLEFGLQGALDFVHEVLVLSLHQEMLRRHQGLVLDNCKNKHRHKYKNTWIIALAMSRRRRIFLVFMALSIGCYCYCEDDPGVNLRALITSLIHPPVHHILSAYYSAIKRHT